MNVKKTNDTKLQMYFECVSLYYLNVDITQTSTINITAHLKNRTL